jgi:hypothetical protein
MSRSWRDIFAPIIADVIRRIGTEDMRRLRSELRKAFPAGERRYWPYKVWLDEIRIQLGRKKIKQKRTTPTPAELNTPELFDS